ncbi:hypothetical protein FKM82_002138 [Ascaphus truei]
MRTFVTCRCVPEASPKGHYQNNIIQHHTFLPALQNSVTAAHDSRFFLTAVLPRKTTEQHHGSHAEQGPDRY